MLKPISGNREIGKFTQMTTVSVKDKKHAILMDCVLNSSLFTSLLAECQCNSGGHQESKSPGDYEMGVTVKKEKKDSGTRLRESFVNNLDKNDIEDENDVSLQETPLVYLDEHIQELEKEIQEARQEGRANQENEGLPSSSDKERSARITELQNTLNEYKEERVRREEKMDAFRKKYVIKKGEDVDLETVVRIFLDLNPSENLIRIFKGVALKASVLKVRFEHLLLEMIKYYHQEKRNL